MNQPKYKIGEKLVAACGYTAEVESIHIRKEGIYYYGGPAGVGHGEEKTLKMYQEPEPKKLYAYTVHASSEVRFYTNSTSNIFSHMESAPLYDIDYPVNG